MQQFTIMAAETPTSNFRIVSHDTDLASATCLAESFFQKNIHAEVKVYDNIRHRVAEEEGRQCRWLKPIV